MSTNRFNSIVIVGGGTAGWVSACILAKHLESKNPKSVQVTVIESPDIPTVGVGEGTWPTMRRTLESIGVDETAFIKQCQATFKQGTRFIGWNNSQERQAYYNLFSSIYDPGEFNLAPYWSLGLAGKARSYAESVSAQGIACDQFLAPKKITSKSYEALQSYAYHLDAGLFADFLKNHATTHLGVTHLPANVQDVLLDEQGSIEAVSTDEYGEVCGDLFIDCTGFRSLLLGDALGVGFKELNDTLFNDRAIAMQVPYPDADSEIECVTLSTAQPAGWIWDIGLQNRRGVGHVYSSRYMDDDTAEGLLRDYVGDGSKELSTRNIKMKVGCRKQFWRKNCVAIGLSAAFMEPLEASAIFLVEAAANMVADLFPRNNDAMHHAQEKFNKSFEFRWDRTVDFIKLHYVLSPRSDSEFWRDNKHSASIPASLQKSLKAWANHPVSKYDFSDINEPFPHESYQYILHGMGFAQNLGNIDSYPNVMQAKKCFENVQKATQFLCDELPTHRDLINRVHQYGFQNL